VREKGLNLFYSSIENRKLCCGVRKVEPLKRALATVDAWITGLRREQVVTRAAVKKVDIDTGFGGIVPPPARVPEGPAPDGAVPPSAEAAGGGIAKINPLTDWTWDQTMAYVKKNNIPYNVLHDQGYPSIGCAPCTRAIKPGEDFRAGRWWWELPEQKECGLHVAKH
jgi:phosphoadenosine phosphosulfate reductase